MIAFPNCKINLGLHIIAKRSDGYHDLETIFYPLPLKDAVEIIQSQKTELTLTGLEVEGNPADNLCLKAYHLLKKDYPELPPVKIHLHKTIPLGAGLGGGSADGAFMLKLIGEKFCHRRAFLKKSRQRHCPPQRLHSICRWRRIWLWCRNWHRHRKDADRKSVV